MANLVAFTLFSQTNMMEKQTAFTAFLLKINTVVYGSYSL